MQNTLAFVILEQSQIGEARRSAVSLAASLGFHETVQGQLALVVTEIATNIVRHASRGELHLRVLESKGVLGIEILAVDQGPGMANVKQCLRDGYSTAGTAGNGLGAISRLSGMFEIYSQPGVGTVLLAQIWEKPSGRSEGTMDCGVINRPKPGQEVCGDSWAIEHLPGRSLFLIADGLGHGPDAAAASRETVRAFRKHGTRRPGEILEAAHGALHGTRGAAVAIAEINFEKQEVCFAGIGNIAGVIVLPEKNQNMVSHNGIVGHQIRKIQEFTYGWEPNALLVMHSDGVSARWHLDQYAGITLRHPGFIAGVLYRDFQRDNDDATVLVASLTRRDSESE